MTGKPIELAPADTEPEIPAEFITTPVGRKAQAWDAYVSDVKRSMALLEKDRGRFTVVEEYSLIEDAKGIKGLCERYGLESPF